MFKQYGVIYPRCRKSEDSAELERRLDGGGGEEQAREDGENNDDSDGGDDASESTEGTEGTHGSQSSDGD